MQFRDYRNFEYNKSAPLLILLTDDQDLIDSTIVEESLRLSKHEKKTLWIRSKILDKFPSYDVSNFSAKELSQVKIKYVQSGMTISKLILDFCSTIQNQLEFEFYQILIDLKEWSISVEECELTGMLAVLSDTALYILSKRDESLDLISTENLDTQSSFPITIFLSPEMKKNNIYMATQFSSNIKTIDNNKNIVDSDIDNYL
uniref:Type II-A CRISPR-associated protein Csn2 n=1 Tax=Strongyloides papillosus TaxID=174720 RepID=A0A0N5BW82_STREA